MTHEEAILKVQKLLRLSQSSNPNEAALAASRAQEIMDRHKIDTIALEQQSAPKPDEPIKDFGTDPLDPEPYATWKGRLAMTLAKQNQCIAYKNRAGIALIGRPSDVGAVRYLYGWLVREVESLARANCAGNGRTYTNNYRIGVVETVCKRLTEAQAATIQAVKSEAGDGTLALVRVNTALATIERRASEVTAWQKAHLKLRSAGRSSYRSDPSARMQGRLDGNKVRMQPSAGSLGAGTRQLSCFN